MSVPASRQLATVLRAALGATDDAVRVWPAATAAGTPEDGYALVSIGGTTYQVPSILGAFNRDPDTGEQVAGEVAYLLVTHDSILAVGRPNLPEYELPPEYGGGTATVGAVVIGVRVVHFRDRVTFGDGLEDFVVTDDLNGWRLVDADAWVSQPASSGFTSIQLRKGPGGATGTDMLSTPIVVSAGAYSSYAVGTPPAVVNAAAATVAVGQIISVDVDDAGLNAKGLGVWLEFAAPP